MPIYGLFTRTSICRWCGTEYDPSQRGPSVLFCSKKCEVESKRDSNFNGPYNPFA